MNTQANWWGMPLDNVVPTGIRELRHVNGYPNGYVGETYRVTYTVFGGTTSRLVPADYVTFTKPANRSRAYYVVRTIARVMFYTTIMLLILAGATIVF